MIRIAIYLLSIILANVITARFAPMELGLFIIPYGTLFIGLTLVMRDMVQNRFGRSKTYLLIVVALVLSALSSYILGDQLWVVFASTLSFIVSETADTEIYTRFKLPFVRRVFIFGCRCRIFGFSIICDYWNRAPWTKICPMGISPLRDIRPMGCKSVDAISRCRRYQASGY